MSSVAPARAPASATRDMSVGVVDFTAASRSPDVDDKWSECPLCKEMLCFPVTTLCGHSMCKPCARALAARGSRRNGKRECPTCTRPIGDFCTNNTVDHRLEMKLKKHFGSEYKIECKMRMKDPSSTRRNMRKSARGYFPPGAEDTIHDERDGTAANADAAVQEVVQALGGEADISEGISLPVYLPNNHSSYHKEARHG